MQAASCKCCGCRRQAAAQGWHLRQQLSFNNNSSNSTNSTNNSNNNSNNNNTSRLPTAVSTRLAAGQQQQRQQQQHKQQQAAGLTTAPLAMDSSAPPQRNNKNNKNNNNNSNNKAEETTATTTAAPAAATTATTATAITATATTRTAASQDETTALSRTLTLKVRGKMDTSDNNNSNNNNKNNNTTDTSDMAEAKLGPAAGVPAATTTITPSDFLRIGTGRKAAQLLKLATDRWHNMSSTTERESYVQDLEERLVESPDDQRALRSVLRGAVAALASPRARQRQQELGRQPFDLAALDRLSRAMQRRLRRLVLACLEHISDLGDARIASTLWRLVELIHAFEQREGTTVEDIQPCAAKQWILLKQLSAGAPEALESGEGSNNNNHNDTPESGKRLLVESRQGKQNDAARGDAAKPLLTDLSDTADVQNVVVLDKCASRQGQQRYECKHGKLVGNCRQCHGCPHGKVKGKCQQCSGCPHGRVKYDCVKCNPCPHGRIKSDCAQCNACPHGRAKRLQAMQRLPPRKAEAQLRTVWRLPARKAKKGLLAMQRLRAWQAETQLRAVHWLPPREAQVLLRDLF
ncbi:unnamed protein product [Polarella glacialis]|uniref:Uncharacterized protein n=1 Tax=Polarella glacialis TaxID=89957 RepID=A0A813HKS7_POLGL|nr:unnamed protein product [Polarella glacialis]CAE8659493.1 unnamed protein product [Polarella glacialis]